MTKTIVPIVHDELERLVASLSIKEQREFVILSPAKIVVLVPIETPTKPRFMIETASAQGMTRSDRYYTKKELDHGGQKRDQEKRSTR